MGVFRVEVEFANPAGPQKCVLDALVDTGATLSLLPAHIAQELQLVAIDRRTFQWANGEEVSYDLASVLVC